MKIYTDVFKQVISPENLFLAWDEFKKGKLGKADVCEFEHRLEENIFELHRGLKCHSYKHDAYTAFTITDPKQRRIHKATVRDRVLHHAIFRVLNPIFEPTFISHSFSCRIGKGTHRGVEALARMLNQASQNNRKTCFALKCDVRKFFDSINHQILLGIIKRRIKDPDFHWLIDEVVGSFDLGSPMQLGLFGTEREGETAACGRQ